MESTDMSSLLSIGASSGPCRLNMAENSSASTEEEHKETPVSRPEKLVLAALAHVTDDVRVFVSRRKLGLLYHGNLHVVLLQY